MNETPITIVGNLTGDPVVRTTQSGRVVTNFRVASTPRRYNRESSSYEDSDTLWMSVVCWQDIARNAAQSLKRGDPVVVFGRLASREYTKDEQRRVNFEVTADAIGHNLARGTSTFAKVNRSVGVSSMPVGDDGTPEDMTDELLEAQLREADLQSEAFSVSERPLPDSGPLVPIG